MPTTLEAVADLWDDPRVRTVMATRAYETIPQVMPQLYLAPNGEPVEHSFWRTLWERVEYCYWSNNGLLSQFERGSHVRLAVISDAYTALDGLIFDRERFYIDRCDVSLCQLLQTSGLADFRRSDGGRVALCGVPDSPAEEIASVTISSPEVTRREDSTPETPRSLVLQ
jgi:hypothetical protein